MDFFRAHFRKCQEVLRQRRLFANGGKVCCLFKTRTERKRRKKRKDVKVPGFVFPKKIITISSGG